MARYIDADKFLESQIERCGGVMPIIGTCTMDNEALSWVVEKTPTADVVEIPCRCKDCLHSTERQGFEKHMWDDDCVMCDYIAMGNRIPVKKNGFCSYGERKCDE